MNTFTKKVLSGMTSLAIAAPMTIGIAFAAETETTDSSVPTQTCVSARTAADDALIAAKSSQTSAEVSAIQAHKAALIAAAALTDVAAKKAAFKKAETDLRTAMKTAMEASRTSLKASMDAVKTACEKAAMGMPERRMMEGKEKGKKGFMNKMMNAFGRNKNKKMMKNDDTENESSSTSNAQ